MVTIEGLRFMPETLIVMRGERVTWVNKDPFPHTVTANSKAFDSGKLGPDMSWSFVARSEGTYTYGCSLHPTMKGILIVRAPAHP
jgi:plastocyanin